MQALAGACTTADTTWMVRLLNAADGHATALADRRGELTYADLLARVEARQADFGLAPRSLVVLSGERSVEYVVSYLALLAGGHVPILGGGHAERLAAAWRPVATIDADDAGWSIEHHRGAATPLHPDLALLLSTSGSTGAPKLVRLSAGNLAANAAAIADSLELTAGDRGITALPLHYCYGLSVLHSHLAVGAGVVVETASVVDPCFADALARHRVTSVPTVAHMLDLLEHGGAERLRVPSLRLVTHAGGRLDPDVAQRWLDRATEWGIDFVAMYGQTEATARMAYLPSALARIQPGTVGLAVPGGSLRVEPLADLPDGAPADAGEIVYRGPNVMMGYAERPADLARPAELHELRTGDLGSVDPATGAVTIVGRRARFVKPFGVRIDLDQVERELLSAGFGGAGEVAAAGDDGFLAVAAPAGTTDRLRAHLVDYTGLPAHRIGVATALPRRPNGKPDYPALLDAARPAPGGNAAPSNGVAAAIGAVLGLAEVGPDDTFVGLGGDSLSYIEVALHLEPALGRLPADWHLMTVGELEARAAARAEQGRRRRWWQWTDTTALCRAVGIATVVLTHMRWAYVPGGAHVMLAVVAYNLSRFLLPVESTVARLRLGLHTLARVVIPTVAWVAAGMLLFGAYSWGTLLLVNGYTGPRHHRDDYWHFWFVEVLVQIALPLLALLAIPAVRRAERRWQYAVPLALVPVGVLLRQEWAQWGGWYNLRYQAHGALLFFVLGWLVQRSTSVRLKLLTTAVIAATVYDTFQVPRRELYVGIALVVLLWWREVPLPRPLAWAVALVASATMWLLITHFTVYPWMMERLPIGWAYLATMVVGVAAWWLVDRATRLAGALWRRRRAPANLLVPGWSVA